MCCIYACLFLKASFLKFFKYFFIYSSFYSHLHYIFVYIISFLFHIFKKSKINGSRVVININQRLNYPLYKIYIFIKLSNYTYMLTYDILKKLKTQVFDLVCWAQNKWQ